MDAGTTLCAIVRERAQADFHKDYTYNRQAYAAPSYCAAYMVAHRYGLDTAAFNLTAWLPCTAIWAKNSSGAFCRM